MRGTTRCAALLALGGSTALAGTTSAAPVLRIGAGANPAAIQTAVDQFRTDVGGPNNGVGGTFLAGRREINWDGVSDQFSEPNPFPFDFFNDRSPRGVIFESMGNIGGQHQFRVSASAASGTAVRFANLDPTYSSIFQTFSSEKLFAPRLSNVLDVYFYLPGTSIPATVNGFGAVFTDVDSSSTFIEFYGPDGKKLSGNSLNVANNGLTFLGTSFNAGERIARVEMRLGTVPLQGGTIDGTTGNDVVALDDFIYGEPQADPSVYRFADAQINGAEDGTATVSVIRTGRGPGSVELASSDGTAKAGSDFTAVHQTLTFGLNETVKTVTVPLAKDAVTEGDETVKLALANPTGGKLGDPANATLTIIDRPPPAPTPTPAPTPPASVQLAEQDRSAPIVTLGKASKKLTRAAFLRGVKVAVTTNEPSSLVADLLGKTDRATLLRVGGVEIAPTRTLPLAGGTRTLTLHPTSKLLRGARKPFTARLRVVATDAAGNHSTVTRSLSVR